MTNLESIKREAREALGSSYESFEIAPVVTKSGYDNLIKFLDTFADRLLEEVEKAVQLKEEKSKYPDTYRGGFDAGWNTACNQVKEAFAKFKGV